MRMTVTAFLIWLFLAHLGVWGLLGILVFIVGYIFLFIMKDEKTAFELMGIAWLLVLLSIAMGILVSYRGTGPPIDPVRLQEEQNLVLVVNLVFSLLFTLPFVWEWGKRESQKSLRRGRLILFSVLITLLDLLVQVLFAGPLFGWDYTPEEPPDAYDYNEEPEEIRKTPILPEENKTE